MAIYKNRVTREFAQIRNDLLADPSLSFKAKGILSYLLSRPPTWEACISDIVNRATDGIHAVRSGLDELEEQGFIIRSQLRDDEGRFSGFQFDVYDAPQPQDNRTTPQDRTRTVLRKPDNGKPVNGDSHPNNTDSTNTDSTNTKRTGASPGISPGEGLAPQDDTPIQASDMLTQEGRDRILENHWGKWGQTDEGDPLDQAYLDLLDRCDTLASYNPPIEIDRVAVLRFIHAMIETAGVPLDYANKSEVRFWIDQTQGLLRKADWDLNLAKAALRKALMDGLSIKGPQSVHYAVADVKRKAKQRENGPVSGGDGGRVTRIHKIGGRRRE